MAARAESLEHPWTIPELSKLLDDIRAVDPAPLGRLESARQREQAANLREAADRGEILSPEESKALAFGPAAENGLRAACVLEPVMASYPLGEIVKCQLVFQNSGTETVKFDTWRFRLVCDSTVRKPDGKETDAKGDWDPFFGSLPRRGVIELKPGEALAFDVRGAAIGGTTQFDFMEEYTKGTIGFGVASEAADEVRLTWQVLLPKSDSPLFAGAAEAWHGNLQTGEIRFVVDKEKPRVETATGPGSFSLIPGGTAKERIPALGDLFNTAHHPTLHIVRDAPGRFAAGRGGHPLACFGKPSRCRTPDRAPGQWW